MNIFDNKRSLSVAVKALQSSKTEVPFNKTWQKLHEELGIGDVSNKSLCLTATDRSDLSKIILVETGINTETIDLSFFSSATRIEVSNLANEEKWAGRKIKEDIVYIRSLTDTVKLTRNYRVPSSGYLATTWQEASKHKHQTFIIIENLEAFLVAERVSWSDEIRQLNPMFLYRGDKEVTPAAINHFIKNSELSYSVFFDYDPAGLMMALTLPREPLIIVPDASIKLLKLHTKKLAFNKQITARMFLGKIDRSHHCYSQANDLVNNKIAVMQEKMISQNMALITILP